MLDWLEISVKALNKETKAAALDRQQILTKPAGSLGKMESLAVSLATMQGSERPSVDKTFITVFAADHGIAAEGVSAYPQAVTAQMIANFLAGGAAISVCARELGASLEIVNLGAVEPLPHEFIALAESSQSQFHQVNISNGTLSFLTQQAMTEEQLVQAMNAGKEAAERAFEQGAQLFIGGEMGIGNTTTATALACALLNRPALDIAGPGTGITPEGIKFKAQMIEQAIAFHKAAFYKTEVVNPLAILTCLGGFEIVALCGAYLRSAQLGLPVLVDGFICSVAALFAQSLNQECREWMVFSHQSAEPGHRIILEAMNGEPILKLEMRLGEGSGAAIAVSLLKTACALHNQMATFAEAGVDDKG
ncbi:nicotinate-nucleotide--dimethylbenzimidazole phosphoribosyltransferase [Litoribacillus peritrichatus]|uniref:Nicotinate-nucleotide--dimethylbenzimidazole phosphoribosyltransferase n=1 Tax=Litoribacillus peritrichatus TaxID=718191 RepID=A0ABP7MER7_9GAMM